jgi:dTDP-4-amino-4,6-dideoxygalactose transaminase
MEKLAVHGGSPVRRDFLVYGAPDIGDEEIREVVDCLKSGWLSTGPRATRLEDDVRAYTGAEYAVATNSCTAALHLSLLAAGVGPGDEVITTPITFGATANVIEHVGATLVLADLAKESFLIDPEAIEACITDRTKAIIPVHFAGAPCDMSAIDAVARKRNIAVIEDAAHALGTMYGGRPIGDGSNIACFSFYVTKNIAAGEGGMVTTNNAAFADLMRCYGLHGMSRGAWQRYTSTSSDLHYDIVYPGYKYNMPDLAAAVALQQLKKLDRFLATRQEYAELYFELLKDQDALILPKWLRPESASHRCAWHLFPILIRPERLSGSREDIMRALIAENVGVATHFRGLFEQPYYREKYRLEPDAYPNGKFVSDRVFSIPLSTKLTRSDIHDVVSALDKVLTHFRR